MPPVCRVGDIGSHGGSNSGVITNGSLNVNADGLAVAVIGSAYNCSEHGLNSIISSPVTDVIVNSQAVAVVGSVCACGAVITSGSPNVSAA
jgi:uncharacterized Zn-binding protein involved in type VI secretion